MRKMVNGQYVELTAEEVAARLAEEAKWAPPPPPRTVASLSRAEKEAISETMIQEWLDAHPGKP